MQITKKERRQRRAVRARAKIRELGSARLTIHRTPRHIYAQVFDATGGLVLASASTVQDEVAAGLSGTGNVEAAKAVGRAIAERAKLAGVTKVAFDRAGFMYHGRIKALADAIKAAPAGILPVSNKSASASASFCNAEGARNGPGSATA